MKNRIILFFILTIPLLKINAQEKDNRPNIIFILTDDQSYGYMGITGNKIVKTPNLDRLADEGTLFTNAHVTSPICMPSRVSMFLSQFERKHGVNFNSGTAVAKTAWNKSYPVLLRKSGYYTAYVGKNHAPVGPNGYQSGVIEKSFDYWYAGHRHLGFYPKERHEIFSEAAEDTQIEVVGEAAIDALDNNEYRLEKAIKVMDKRPDNKPFLLNICFNLPHGAGTESMKMRESDPEIYKSLYRDQDIKLASNYLAKNEINTPKLPHSIHHTIDRQNIYDYVNTPEETKERLIRQYQAMTGIDRLVGKLRNKLKEMDLDKNTIIVFTSDHGLLMGQYGLGGKGLLYETCTHVPMIILDPRVPKQHRVKTSDALVQSIDIAPTLLDNAQVQIPSSFQGKNISPLLTKGEKTEVREYIYTENLWSNHFGNPRCEAVQDKEWKYIRYYKNENFSASDRIKYTKALGFKTNKALYGVTDKEIAVYRSYAEGPLMGEETVYEELYCLEKDPKEQDNLVSKKAYQNKLMQMRQVWNQKIKEARGKGQPDVDRFTNESMAETQKRKEL